eukprot:2372493-Amphidinium_carterae.1
MILQQYVAYLWWLSANEGTAEHTRGGAQAYPPCVQPNATASPRDINCSGGVAKLNARKGALISCCIGWLVPDLRL